MATTCLVHGRVVVHAEISYTSDGLRHCGVISAAAAAAVFVARGVRQLAIFSAPPSVGRCRAEGPGRGGGDRPGVGGRRATATRCTGLRTDGQ